MRIFKKNFDDRLTVGMSVGECIITKTTNAGLGNFQVNQKVEEGFFPYLGTFGLLEHAIKFVNCIKEVDNKFEYYCQYSYSNLEGLNRESLEVMGQLGWELCGVDSNVKNDKGWSYYIFKRKIESLPLEIKEKTELHDEELGDWTATVGDLKLRDTVKSRVGECEYIHKDKFTKVVSIHFGKNGWGLTNELITIGKKIEELSKDSIVYIKDAYIDSIDDVYTLIFTIKPIENV